MIPISPLRIDSVRFAPAAKENAIDASHSASQRHLHLEFGIRWLQPDLLTDDLEKKTIDASLTKTKDKEYRCCIIFHASGNFILVSYKYAKG